MSGAAPVQEAAALSVGPDLAPSGGSLCCSSGAAPPAEGAAAGAQPVGAGCASLYTSFAEASRPICSTTECTSPGPALTSSCAVHTPHCRLTCTAGHALSLSCLPLPLHSVLKGSAERCVWQAWREGALACWYCQSSSGVRPRAQLSSSSPAPGTYS
jgi:hypothetical protein